MMILCLITEQPIVGFLNQQHKKKFKFIPGVIYSLQFCFLPTHFETNEIGFFSTRIALHKIFKGIKNIKFYENDEELFMKIGIFFKP